MLSVLIVDEHILFREGLQSLLSQEPDFRVVGQVSSLHEAIECIHNLRPDVVLIDLHLEDGEGTDVLGALPSNGHGPPPSVVMLASTAQDDALFEAIRRGAKGYILKSTPFASLAAALRRVQHGELALSRVMASRLIEHYRQLGNQRSTGPASLDALTPREFEVLRHLGTGASNQMIAKRLVISEHTVKVHVHNILAKLNLRNRAEAAALSRRHGLERPALSTTPD